MTESAMTDMRRPFDGYRTAVTDPDFFFGRDAVLRMMRGQPQVYMLLGGRRIGKTSTLRALEWTLLELSPNSGQYPFPVMISLEIEQPVSLDHLRLILIANLRRAFDQWRSQSWANFKRAYRRFLGGFADVKLSVEYMAKLEIKLPGNAAGLASEDFRRALNASIGDLRQHGFAGVVFLFDEAEFIVRQTWANDAWSYFRGIKDSDLALKPFFHAVISGYRSVHEYQQKAGSPLLNIAKVCWLDPLNGKDSRKILQSRESHEAAPLSADEQAFVLDHAGGHPFLLQQILNCVLDRRQSGQPWSERAVLRSCLSDHDRIFEDWWNPADSTDGFNQRDRAVYEFLSKSAGRCSIDEMLEGLAIAEMELLQSLRLLTATGVIHQVDEEHYSLGGRLFAEWVRRRQEKSSA